MRSSTASKRVLSNPLRKTGGFKITNINHSFTNHTSCNYINIARLHVSHVRHESSKKGTLLFRNTLKTRQLADSPLHKTQKRTNFFYQSNEPVVPVLGNKHEGGHPLFYYIALVGLNVGVFLLWNNPTTDTEWMTKNFTVNLENLKQGRLWTLVSCAISHRDLEHIAGNMVALLLFGYKTYRALGFAACTGLYVVGGIAASVAHCGFNLLTGHTAPRRDDHYLQEQVKKVENAPEAYREQMIEQLNKDSENRDIPSLGASGSVMAVAAAAATLFPRDKILVRNFYIPLPLAVAVYMGSDLLGLANWRSDPTSHAGHLAGSLVGISYSVFLWYVAGKRGKAGNTLPILSWIGRGKGQGALP